jgi:Protein of unknown function (DUF2829)
MTFEEALKYLVSGEYVQRSEWLVTGEYVISLPGIPYIWKILTTPTPNAGNWLPTIADLMAEDYEVVNKVEPEIETMVDAA